MLDPSERLDHWHRRLSPLTDWLIVSGDLSDDNNRALSQLGEWDEAGVTHVLDCRIEWSDEDRLATLVPGLEYLSLGIHDDGTDPGSDWWEAGLRFADEARRVGGRLLVFCHLGINRGPSMAYRLLLEVGWGPVEAIELIRQARPVAHIRYAEAALCHFTDVYSIPESMRSEALAQVGALVRPGGMFGWERPAGDGGRS